MTEVVVTNLFHPDAMLVRQEVFVEEQGFHDEFDDIDEIADHYLLYVDGEIAGCCRVFPSKDNGKYTLGRLAIRKKYLSIRKRDFLGWGFFVLLLTI